MPTTRHSIIPSTACLIFHAGKVLLIQYSDKKGERVGRYNRIGGHIEQGEGILANARREILEETGLQLDVTLRGVIHVSNYYGKHFMLFVTTSNASTDVVRECDEGTLHRVDPAMLDDYQIFKDVKLVINEIAILQPGELFTATTIFDGQGELVSFSREQIASCKIIQFIYNDYRIFIVFLSNELHNNYQARQKRQKRI
ncbi:MAG: NUDIX domain-containing protein [bacterium]|nr:NUDIX domain-containing protein [bacterium]